MTNKAAVGTVMNDSAGDWVNRVLQSIPASYAVWKDGATYRAECNIKGGDDYSGLNPATVLQNVLAASINRKVFLTNATYDLGGATLTATSPIMLFGEGNQAVIKNGILKIVGDGDWTDNITTVKNLRFENAGGTVCLWLQSVIHSLISENVFYKSSYTAGSPSLRLTTCLTTRVEHNWFDGYQMQILKIDGVATTVPLHIIRDNDFGSTATAFPSYSDPAEVAAIHIFDASNLGVTIEGNLAYLNTKNVFIVSEAPQIHIINNRITCGSLNYAVDLRGNENLIDGNLISVPSTSYGAISIRNPSDLAEPKYRNIIVNNKIYGMECTNAVYGVMHRGVINGNHIEAKTGLKLHNSGYNSVEGNVFSKYGASGWIAIEESGSTGVNIVMGNEIETGMAVTPNPTGGSIFKHNKGYVTENYGGSTGTGAQQTIVHGLVATPKLVTVVPNVTGAIVSSVWADATNIYCTVTSGKTYNWTAEV